jgi:hypothetical protein
MTLAAPTVLSSSTRPTGVCPFDTGVHELMSFELIANDTFALRLPLLVRSPAQRPLSLIVVVSVRVAVLLAELVVQKNREPV